jgi:long-chain fatty acid transport protein
LKRRATSFFAAACFAALLPAALFAGGFQLNEHGARAMAQAGAFSARANDPSAIFFNPAGLSFLRGTQVMVGATAIMPSYTYYGPSNLQRNDKWEMESQTFTPPNAYLTHTWTDGMLKGLAVGIGVVTPYGLGTKWPDNWIGKAITQEINLKTFFISPTVSYAINDMIAVGGGVNIVMSDVLLRRAVTNFSPEMQLNLEGTGKTAISFNAGVMLKPTEQLSIGFTYRSATQLDFEGTANFSPPTSLAALFPGGDVTTGIKLPATYFAAVAWMPNEDFSVEVDYQGIGWSSYDKLTIDFAKDAAGDPTGVIKQADVTSPKNYEDSYIIRFGAEYKLPMLGLRLRAGWLYDKNPVPDAHLEPLLPDADRNGLTLGAGMNLTPNLTIDAAYMNLMFKDRTTTATSFPDGVYLDGSYSGSAQLFGVDLTYHF